MSYSKELLDIVDLDGNVIGQATRGACHENPKLMHPVVFCWLFNRKGQILWQQRSHQKDKAPGIWDGSCGGHIRSGDTPEMTIHRELEEELGVKDVQLEFVGKHIRGDETQTELFYLYFGIVEEGVELKLQIEEVEQVMWIDIEEAQMKFIRKEVEATDFVITHMAKILQYLIFRNANPLTR